MYDDVSDPAAKAALVELAKQLKDLMVKYEAIQRQIASVKTMAEGAGELL